MALKCLIKRIIFYYSLISIITKIIIPIIIGLIHLLLNKAHRVERVPLRLSPDHSDRGSIPTWAAYPQSCIKEIVHEILAIHKCNFIQYCT